MLTDARNSYIVNPPSFGDHSADICFVPVHRVFLSNIFSLSGMSVCVVEWLMLKVCVFVEVPSGAAVNGFPEDLGAGTWPC